MKKLTKFLTALLIPLMFLTGSYAENKRTEVDYIQTEDHRYGKLDQENTQSSKGVIFK